jgi:hypothetical protein
MTLTLLQSSPLYHEELLLGTMHTKSGPDTHDRLQYVAERLNLQGLKVAFPWSTISLLRVRCVRNLLNVVTSFRYLAALAYAALAMHRLSC